MRALSAPITAALAVAAPSLTPAAAWEASVYIACTQLLCAAIAHTAMEGVAVTRGDPLVPGTTSPALAALRVTGWLSFVGEVSHPQGSTAAVDEVVTHALCRGLQRNTATAATAAAYEALKRRASDNKLFGVLDALRRRVDAMWDEPAAVAVVSAVAVAGDMHSALAAPLSRGPALLLCSGGRGAFSELEQRWRGYAACMRLALAHART